MVIVIEGLDGIGKTTTAKLLAQELNGQFFPWLHPPFKQALPYIWENDSVSEASKHLAFLAAFKHMSDIADSEPYRSETIVTDRYYFCSLAMHPPLAELSGERPLDFDRACLAFKKPDFTFYLELEEEIRRQRLSLRGAQLTPVEKLLDANPAFCLAVRKNFDAMAAARAMTRIPIGGLSPKEIVQKILGQIRAKISTVQ